MYLFIYLLIYFIFLTRRVINLTIAPVISSFFPSLPLSGSELRQKADGHLPLTLWPYGDGVLEEGGEGRKEREEGGRGKGRERGT